METIKYTIIVCILALESITDFVSLNYCFSEEKKQRMFRMFLIVSFLFTFSIYGYTGDQHAYYCAFSKVQLIPYERYTSKTKENNIHSFAKILSCKV